MGTKVEAVYAARQAEYIAAVEASLPESGKQELREPLFKLARKLKAIPGSAAAYKADGFDRVAHYWCGKAAPLVGEVSRHEVRLILQEAWGKVRFLEKEDVVAACAIRAMDSPEIKCAAEFVGPMRFLVALCYQLQQANGKSPFWLSCRSAAKYIGVPFRRAADMLRTLVKEDVLKLVDKCKRPKAYRYRFTGEV